jgi:gamma-glutamyltranspeptidase
VGAKLLDKRHSVRSVPGDWVGGYQAIMVTPDVSPTPGASVGRTYRAGSDHRMDGQAVGY